MASHGSKAGGGGGASVQSQPLNAEQQALTGFIQRAEQAVADGKRRDVVDAFRTEMRYAGIGSRPDIFRRSDDIDEDVRVAARNQILPEINTDTESGWREQQNRTAQRHEIQYGIPRLESIPDANGFAEYSIPVLHRWIKGATSTNAGQGKKTKKEETVKVRVNVLKGQGFRESQGSSGESRPWDTTYGRRSTWRK